MASWRSPGRAERVVIYEEGFGPRQYWRGEDAEGNVVWCENEPADGRRRSGGELSTEQLLGAIEASVRERRRAARGRTFRL